jgi:hypothetical protein
MSRSEELSGRDNSRSRSQAGVCMSAVDRVDMRRTRKLRTYDSSVGWLAHYGSAGRGLGAGVSGARGGIDPDRVIVGDHSAGQAVVRLAPDRDQERSNGNRENHSNDTTKRGTPEENRDHYNSGMQSRANRHDLGGQQPALHELDDDENEQAETEELKAPLRLKVSQWQDDEQSDERAEDRGKVRC